MLVQRYNFSEQKTRIWQKKLEKGQIAHYDVLRNGVILTNKYPKIINTDVYQVENRIFRIYKDTKEILDIIK